MPARRRPWIVITIGPRGGGCLLASALLLAAPSWLGSETLTLSTTYPSPAGIYNQLVTTGDGPKNTVLNRDAGNTLLSPPTNAGGRVGVGTSNPSYKLDVQGGQANASGGLCIAGDCRTSWPSGVPDGVRMFTADGSFTVPAGVTRVLAYVFGGGGGGGRWSNNPGGGGGGGAGGAAIKILTVTPGQVLAVTVGLGGAGQTSGPGCASAGGASSFAGVANAAGGGAGCAGGFGNGGAGGGASGGDVNLPGGRGIPGGGGGSNLYGSGGASTGGPWPSDGSSFGGGGAAGVVSGQNGTRGGDGRVLVWW